LEDEVDVGLEDGLEDGSEDGIEDDGLGDDRVDEDG